MTLFRRPDSLEMTAQHWAEMRDEVARKVPEEACGLLVGTVMGRIYHVAEVIPTVNILSSPVGYRLDPQEQLDAFDHIEKQGWELLGIYHSHPEGPETPSPTDIAEAYYPEAVYLIWSGYSGKWTCRGFIIQEKSVHEIPIKVRNG